jgi:phosphopantothenoylcysteine synthetase/decarboxylase
MGEILTNLMKDYKEKTFNGAIVKILKDVSYLKNKNRELASKLDKSEINFHSLRSDVMDFKSSFENLFEDKNVKEIESDKEDNEICPECASILHNGYCDECEDYV